MISGTFASGFLEHFGDREQRGFGVQSIENRFNDQKIDAASEQSVDLIEDKSVAVDRN